MAVTLDEISGWLEQLEYKYQKEEEQIMLMTGDDDSTSVHFIRAKDDGRIFEWKMSIID